MCDYSLQGLPNRLANEGEELVTYRFMTGSIGLASPADITAATSPQPETANGRPWLSALKRWLAPRVECRALPAVCIPHGTRLLLSRIPESIRREFALNAVEEVTFVQLGADAFRYRDAIQFPNGRQLLLQSFREGVLFGVVATGPGEAESDKVPERRTVIRPVEEERAGGRPR
jgi:hypothetical protein